MPGTRRNPEKNSPQTETDNKTDIGAELGRISKILALNAVKGLPQNQQISFLSAAGFTIKEIAAMVGTKYQVVNQSLYEMRKSRKDKKKPKKVK